MVHQRKNHPWEGLWRTEVEEEPVGTTVEWAEDM